MVQAEHTVGPYWTAVMDVSIKSHSEAEFKRPRKWVMKTPEVGYERPPEVGYEWDMNDPRKWVE